MKKRLIAWLVVVCMMSMICAHASGILAEETPAQEDVQIEIAAAVEAPTAEPTKEPEATEAPTAEPTKEPEATEAPTVEPTEEPEVTEEPTAVPTEEPKATEEPTAVPTEEPEATEEPTAEPTEEPEVTEEPTAEPTEEPKVTKEPADEPTEKPEATEEPADESVSALTVSVRANAAYATVGKSNVSMTARVGGGTAPYSLNVTISCSGKVVHTQTITLDEEGKASIEYAPGNYGDYAVSVAVSDAVGASASDSAVMPVSILIYETEDEWDESVGEIELTGDWRIDLLTVAETQIGYKESKKNFIIDENGKHGYTRYGDKYNGDYYEWCLMFVCFCMDYAEVPKEDFPRTNRSYGWQETFTEFGVYEDDEHDYEPVPGDLVFFNFDKGNSIHHVGIVYEVTDERIVTIEGNNRGAVRVCDYDRDDRMIVAYANMTALMERSGLFMKEIELSAEELKAYTNGDSVNVRAAAGSTGEILNCISDSGSEVQLLGAMQNVDSIWYRVQYGDVTGYVLSDLLIVQDASGAIVELAVEPIAESAEESADESSVEEFVEEPADESVEETVEELTEETAEEPVNETIQYEGLLIGYTAGDHVNMREASDARSQFVAQIELKGTRVDVLDAVDMGDYIWYQVEYNGYNGYIRGDLITVEEVKGQNASEADAETGAETL